MTSRLVAPAAYEALVELESVKVEALKDLSDEQNKELEQLRNAPTEEVVSWFDSL